MKKIYKFTPIILLLLIGIELFSQGQWQSVVLAEQQWKYLPALNEPPSDWNSTGFDDANWQAGTGGIGYADGDDATVIDPVNSLYLRRAFVVDAEITINRLILDIDYDDAFVAYLNGAEIGRSPNITDSRPLYNSTLLYDREAQMYQGGQPERYFADTSLLITGVNVLAVHILNNGISSSDLSSLVYMHAEINEEGQFYPNTPEWFVAPFIIRNSKLPIVKINTDGQWIPDDPRIVASMGIINNGKDQVNSSDGSFTDYDGRITIETRGQSSQMFPKKSFALETQDEMGENLNVSLLGMPPENDWILYAPYSDKSMLRNALTFEMGGMTDGYSSRMAFCELFINEKYHGVYILMEKIKRDKNRVDIATLNSYENSGDDLTGGYIFKIDKIDDDYIEGISGFKSMPDPSYPNAMDVIYQYYYPKVNDITPTQRSYLKEYIQEAEEVLISSYFDDPDIGYNRYLNTGSFVDFMLINEISKEVDKYRYSNYMHKRKESKGGEIIAGPIWDFNLGYGNVDYWEEGLITSGWLYDDLHPGSWSLVFWWSRLNDDDHFKNLATTRWKYMRQNQWSSANVQAIIDSITGLIDEAQARNYERWPILGEYVWPNYNWQNNSYEDEVTFFSNWLFARLAWLDANFDGRILTPAVSMDLLANNGSSAEYRLTLEDDYFNHSFLNRAHFEVNGTPLTLGIESVHHENASSARIKITHDGFSSIWGTNFTLTIKDSILNGFRPLTTENILVGTDDDPSVTKFDLTLYAASGNIYVKTTMPEMLPERLVIYNSLGQVAGIYPLMQSATNVLPVNLPPDLYIVRVITSSGPVTRKVIISE